GASRTDGRPGTSAMPMPAITSRIDGARLKRLAATATAASTASMNRTVCMIAVIRLLIRHPEVRARSATALFLLSPFEGAYRRAPQGDVPMLWPNDRAYQIKFDTVFTVSASTVTLKKNESTPWIAAMRRMYLLVMPTSDTCDVMPMTS